MTFFENDIVLVILYYWVSVKQLAIPDNPLTSGTCRNLWWEGKTSIVNRTLLLTMTWYALYPCIITTPSFQSGCIIWVVSIYVSKNYHWEGLPCILKPMVVVFWPKTDFFSFFFSFFSILVVASQIETISRKRVWK